MEYKDRHHTSLKKEGNAKMLIMTNETIDTTEITKYLGMTATNISFAEKMEHAENRACHQKARSRMTS